MNRTRGEQALVDTVDRVLPEGGDRFNEGKPPLWLLPWSVLVLRIPIERRDAAYALWLWCRRDKDAELKSEAQRPGVLEGGSFILQFGATKYAAYNWEKGLSFIETISSGLRHAVADGELDADSGLPHLDHLRCNLIFVAHFDANLHDYLAFDDRPEAAA